MNIDDTSKNSKHPVSASGTDWNRVRLLTEEKLDAAIASDPDTFAPTYEEMAHGHMEFPAGTELLRVLVNKEDTDWLARQNIDSTNLIAHLVHEYVRSHQ
jgi:hypothetical protein